MSLLTKMTKLSTTDEEDSTGVAGVEIQGGDEGEEDKADG